FNHQPTVFLYDTIPGGVGLAQRLYEVRESLLRACLTAVTSCECPAGCPSCVGPQVEPESPAKRAATLLLARLAAQSCGNASTAPCFAFKTSTMP
ncbi:MAG: DUF1998 domain-containing protein, partial [Dehalococcoidia bacterium]|nr:DUF1998 domain-containing protein [Dehalococcoidia bacterium]